MKIGILGISTFGFGLIKWLVSNNYEIIFVTGKFKKAAHVSNLEKDVLSFCLINKINHIGNVDCNSKEIIDIAKKTDLCIIGGYDKILKSEIINAPKLGVINTHFGIIPENRGCNPVMWGIIDKIEQGSTTYWVEDKIDFGKVILTIREPNLVDKTSEYIYNKISQLSIDAIPEIMNRIKNNFIERTMKHEGKYYKQGIPNNGYISLEWSNEKIKRYSDALWFPPYAPAKIKFGKREYFVCVENKKNEKFKIKLYDENPHI